MGVNVIVGLQRGDEGKGRFVDMLAEDHDIVARYGGGPNAGHTVVRPDGSQLKLHGLPSGVAYPHTKNVEGDGVFIDPIKQVAEIDYVNANGCSVSPDNLLLSSSAHLIMPHHVAADVHKEAGPDQQGSTKSGIAQVAALKALRQGVRAEIINNDLDRLYVIVRDGLSEQRSVRERMRVMFGLEKVKISDIAANYVDQARKLGEFITDTALFLNEQLEKEPQARILGEGAQGFWLDLDQGMHPYVTSSCTTSGGVAPGLGIPPTSIDRVIGVAKAIPSHVGGGHFVTEITNADLLNQLHGDKTTIDAEFGTTTNRQRRLGYFDLPQLRRAQMVNNRKDKPEMVLTKLDWIPRYGKQLLVCVAYERKGKVLRRAPNASYKLEQSTPIYEELPNWEEDIQDVRQFADLPRNAQNFVEFIEAQTGVPITMIGVGPQRDQVIVR